MLLFIFFFLFCLLNFINNTLLVINYFHRIQALLGVNNLFLQEKINLFKNQSLSIHPCALPSFSLYLFFCQLSVLTFNISIVLGQVCILHVHLHYFVSVWHELSILIMNIPQMVIFYINYIFLFGCNIFGVQL